MSLRDELAAYRLEVRRVDLPRIPSAHVREWNGLARADVIGALTQAQNGSEDVRVEEVPGLMAFIAVRSLCDSEGLPAFNVDELDVMETTLSGDDIQAIATAAMDLNGLSDSAVEDAAGKS